MDHLLTMPFRTNGSPLTYSSAASRVMQTAMLPSYSWEVLRKAPARRSVPWICNSFERARWGGNDIRCFREGIFEGIIEGLEEYDVIYPLLRYDHRFMTSSSGFLCPCKQPTFYLLGGTCIK